MSMTSRALRVLLACALSLAFTPNAWASIPTRFEVFSQNEILKDEFVKRDGETTELDLKYIHRLTEMARTELRMTVANVLPTNLAATQSETRVAQQILGHSLERWFETSEWAQNTFGDTVKSVEEPFGQGVSIQDASGQSHRVQMKMKAARAIASINYTGWVDASLGYQLSSGTVGLEISRVVGKGKKVSLNHTSDSDDSRQVIAYQFEW
jgi:hypothetical protein